MFTTIISKQGDEYTLRAFDTQGTTYHAKGSKKKMKKLEKLFETDPKKALKKISKLARVADELYKAKEADTELKESYEDKLLGLSVYVGLDIRDDGTVALAEYPEVVMPTSLVDKLISCLDAEDVEEALQPFLKFWYWCLLNPNPEARCDLYRFIESNGLLLTPNGWLITFRRCNVNSNFSDSFNASEDLDVLLELDAFKEGTYLEGTEQTVLTSNHTGKEEYRIGKEVRMRRDKCNPDYNTQCSYGYHVGSASFAKENSSFGSIGTIAVVNPKDVVAVPRDEGWKMRTCAFTLLWCDSGSDLKYAVDFINDNNERGVFNIHEDCSVFKSTTDPYKDLVGATLEDMDKNEELKTLPNNNAEVLRLTQEEAALLECEMSYEEQIKLLKNKLL